MAQYKKLEKYDLKFHYMVSTDGDVLNIDTDHFNSPIHLKRSGNKIPVMIFERREGLSGPREWAIHLDELVMMCFSKEYKKGAVVHHKDGDPNNCKFDNLEYDNPLDKSVDGEIWKKIVYKEINFYYDYYVSSMGRVFNDSTYQYIKTYYVRNKSGHYEEIWLHLYITPDKKIIQVPLSKLVAIHFLSSVPNPDKYVAWYKDNDPSNCNVDNLIWPCSKRSHKLHN